jgi:hypothetical protein
VATRSPTVQSSLAWLAGSTPLNGQAIQDLLEDGWLKRDGDGKRLVIDAWPSFAGDDPGPNPIPDAQPTPQRVDSQAEHQDG